MYKKLLLAACIMGSLLPIAQAQQGLKGEYYDGGNFQKLVMTRMDNDVNFVWNNVAPAPGMNPSRFSARWTGKLQAPKSGKYQFSANVDDGLRLWVGGTLVIDAWDMHDSEDFSGSITLNEGQLYDLKVEYFNGMLEGNIQLKWQLPGEEPVFRGALGYNYKKIDPKYYRQPEQKTTQPVASPVKKPTPKPKPVTPATKKPEPVKPAPKKDTPKPVPPKPTPAPEKPKVVSKDSIELYTPKNILFVKSKSVMLQGSLAELDRLAGFLLRNQALHVSIEGHTDNVGDAKANQKLSDERAKVVADYLVQKGVAQDRVDSKGYGSTRPLSTEDTAAAHMRNRRVVFIIK